MEAQKEDVPVTEVTRIPWKGDKELLITKSEGKLYIPINAKEIQVKLLNLAHDRGCHGGEKEVEYRLKATYYWKNMD